MDKRTLVSRRDFLKLAAGAGAGAILTACGGPPATEQAGGTAAPAAAGAASTAAPAAAAGAAATAGPPPTPTTAPIGPATGGVEITVIGRAVTIPTVLKLGEQWAKDAGIKVTPLEIPGDLGRKILESMAARTHLADVQLFDDNYAADLFSQNYYLEVDQTVKEAINWDDIVPIYRERVAAWQGKSYGIPYDGDNMSMGFRRDIMADADNQSKFKAKYGYEMKPDTGPTTWEEHRQYAEFFTNWDWNKDGQPSYGFAHMWKREGGLFWAYISRAAAYAKHPDVPDFFFNINTGEPLINSEPFVRALTEWKEEMEKFAPPGAVNMQWGDCLNQWKAGRVAMVNWWGDHGKDAQDPENSTIKGKIAFHMTPGSKEVYNQQTKAWVSMPQASYAPYLGFNGRCFGVASTAKNVPQCWEFLKFACSPETTLKVSYTPLAGMEPVRNSQLDVNAWVNSPFKWETREAESWLNTIKENINHPNVVADLRLPGWAEYQDSLETAVSAAVSGEMPIKEALDQAAQGWNEVTDRVGGKEQQMRFYRDIAVGG